MNPVQSLKLLAWAGCATRWAFVAVSLTSGLLVMAQEPDTSSQTNDVMATEALSRLNDLVQGADSAQPEDMAPANDLSSTNNIDQPGTPASSADGTPRINRFDAAGRTDSNSRSQSASDRRSRGRRRSRSDSPVDSGRPATPARAAAARTMAPSRWITPPLRLSWTRTSLTPTGNHNGDRGRCARRPRASIP